MSVRFTRRTSSCHRGQRSSGNPSCRSLRLGTSFDVLSVGKRYVEVLFQYPPVDSIATCRTSKLLSQAATSRRSRVVQPKAAKVLPWLLPLLEQDAGRNRRLVNIDTATPLVRHFHHYLLCRALKDASCENLTRVLFRKERYSPLFLSAFRVKLISGCKRQCRSRPRAGTTATA